MADGVDRWPRLEDKTAYRGLPSDASDVRHVHPTEGLGCWNNFGAEADDDLCRQLVFSAFDRGVTHFDLANNYGPPPGSAEERFGKILKHLPRDEIIISTKAGYLMWQGPYGDGGSRKYLLASLDQSLRRLQVEYVDVFYHHRPDPETRLDESLGALDSAVRTGKALYPAISNYDADQTRRAVSCVEANGFAPLIVNQSKYNMFQRDIEDELLAVAAGAGMGVVAYSPLAQGLLTNRYLKGIPAGSRAGKKHDYSGALTASEVTDEVLIRVRALREVAHRRGSIAGSASDRLDDTREKGWSDSGRDHRRQLGRATGGQSVGGTWPGAVRRRARRDRQDLFGVARLSTAGREERAPRSVRRRRDRYDQFAGPWSIGSLRISPRRPGRRSGGVTVAAGHPHPPSSSSRGIRSAISSIWAARRSAQDGRAIRAEPITPRPTAPNMADMISPTSIPFLK